MKDHVLFEYHIIFFSKIIGAEDPRCPLAGLDVPKARALKAYEDSHSIDNFKVCISTSRGKEIITLRPLLPIQLPLMALVHQNMRKA